MATRTGMRTFALVAALAVVVVGCWRQPQATPTPASTSQPVAASAAGPKRGADAASGRCDRIALPSAPDNLAQVGDRVWIASSADRSVQLADLRSCRMVGRPIRLPKRARVSAPLPQSGWVWGPDRPGRLVADERRLWVSGELTLYRLDPATRRIVRQLTLYRLDRENATRRVPLDLSSVTLNQGTPWAANLAEGETFIYKLASDTGRIQLKEPADSEIVGMTRGAGWVWAISHDRGTLLRVDPRSGRFTRTRFSSEPHGVAFGAGYVWVAMYHQGTILRIDPATGRVVGAPIGVGFPPEPMAAAGGLLWAIPSTGGYMADPRRHTVLKIAVSDGRILGSFRTEGRPRAVVAEPDGAWVATSEPNELVWLRR
jgi:hypothetical protein